MTPHPNRRAGREHGSRTAPPPGHHASARRCGRTGDHPRGCRTRSTARPRSPWRLPRGGSAARACRLPFIREFRLATGAWHKLDREQLANEQRAAATEARRMLDEAARALGVMQSVRCGQRRSRRCSSPPRRMPATSSSSRSRGCRRKPSCMRLRSGCRRPHACAASVMLVPRGLARRQGPVAAVVCAELDPALHIAARIAAAAGESLLLLVWGQRELANGAAEQARAAGLASDRDPLYAALPA